MPSYNSQAISQCCGFPDIPQSVCQRLLAAVHVALFTRQVRKGDRLAIRRFRLGPYFRAQVRLVLLLLVGSASLS